MLYPWPRGKPSQICFDMIMVDSPHACHIGFASNGVAENTVNLETLLSKLFTLTIKPS
jgi:hypothetical protein